MVSVEVELCAIARPSASATIRAAFSLRRDFSRVEILVGREEEDGVDLEVREGTADRSFRIARERRGLCARCLRFWDTGYVSFGRFPASSNGSTTI